MSNTTRVHWFILPVLEFTKFKSTQLTSMEPIMKAEGHPLAEVIANLGKVSETF